MSDKAFLAWLKAHAGQYDFDTYAAQAYNAWNLRSDRATGECFGDLPAHEQAAWHAAATHSVYHALQRRQQGTLSRLALTPGDIVVAAGVTCAICQALMQRDGIAVE